MTDLPPRPVLLAPGVWRVTTPLPFRPRFVHAYLLRAGDGWLLVDGGANTDAAWTELDEAVRAAAGSWESVGAHLVTHMHLDHVGLVERVREASGARLLMGALDAERAAHARAHPEEEAAYRAALLRRGGALEALGAGVEQGRREADPLQAFVPVDAPLAGEGGELAEAPGWRWVWTPGHTAGHVSLFRPEDGVLVAGDAVLPRITPTLGVNRQRRDPVGDYLAALDRLDALGPRRALPGHGEPVDDPAARIAELRRAAEAETEAVAALVAEGPCTAWEAARRRHPHPEYPPSVLMHALRETLAHLDRLVLAGRVREDFRGDGAALFSAAPG
ncbi:MAG TPA: MBL fold metallo-hydrolase [Longimicrobiaceae bacterium]|jgi:glyoxylase-like metal-dependent hydrolase (beta-lactamase superfamily II)